MNSEGPDLSRHPPHSLIKTFVCLLTGSLEGVNLYIFDMLIYMFLLDVALVGLYRTYRIFAVSVSSSCLVHFFNHVN